MDSMLLKFENLYEICKKFNFKEEKVREQIDLPSFEDSKFSFENNIYSILKNYFSNFTYQDSVEFCSKHNWDIRLINKYLDFLISKGCNPNILREKIMVFPLKVMDFSPNVWQFLFDIEKINLDFLIEYKQVIVEILTKKQDIKLNYRNIHNEVKKYSCMSFNKLNEEFSKESVILLKEFKLTKIIKNKVHCLLEELLTAKGDEIINLIERYGISEATIYAQIEAFANKMYKGNEKVIKILQLKLNYYNQNKAIRKKTFKSKAYSTLDIMLNINDFNEIINILDNYDGNLYTLRAAIHNYAILDTSSSYYDKVRNNLMEKFNKYFEYKNRQKQLENELKKIEKVKNNVESILENAKNIVNQFINSSYENIKQFCISINLKEEKFNEYINLVKENDLDLYEKYKAKVNAVHSQNFAILSKFVENIFNFIKNGIEENGVKRDFDLLDYYQLTSMERATFLDIAKRNLKKDDINKILKFLRKYNSSKKLTKSNLEQIFEEKTIVGIEFDEDKRPIPGTGRLISKEEKQKIIDYLKENNIPLYDDCYNIALRRYINGTLVLDLEKQKIN